MSGRVYLIPYRKVSKRPAALSRTTFRTLAVSVCVTLLTVKKGIDG
jgi:hypothetical protein